MSRAITLAVLEKAHACQGQRELFVRVFGDRPVYLNRELAQQTALMFNYDWAISYILPVPRRRAAKAALSAAYKTYETSNDSQRVALRDRAIVEFNRSLCRLDLSLPEHVKNLVESILYFGRDQAHAGSRAHNNYKYRAAEIFAEYWNKPLVKKAKATKKKAAKKK